jgi:hypothetical protein
VEKVKLGNLEVSRFMVGGNPQSGFSHQSEARDMEMVHYFRADRVKALYRQAESLGITTHIGRADHYIMRMLLEYWDEGGTIQWIAQTCPEVGNAQRGAQNGINGGAKAVFLHGGQSDYFLHHGQLDEAKGVIALIHDAGLPAGVAGHQPEVFEWAEENLDCDFYMCSYYNPVAREKTAEHVAGDDERFRDADRERMVATIKHLSKPVIHYKVLAAGRKDPKETFLYVARHMRPGDAVLVGIFPKDDPDQLATDVRLFEEAVKAVVQKLP